MKNILITTLIGTSIVAMGALPANAGIVRVYRDDMSDERCWKDIIRRPFPCPPIIHNSP